MTPAPRTVSAAGSSGQRGRAPTSSESGAQPARKRSIPAQAIIAALSVHKASGGATKRKPRFAARTSSDVRTRALAATPPARTSAVTSDIISRARVIRSRRQSIAACWKLAAMSASLNVGVTVRNWPPSPSRDPCLARSTALLSPAKEKCGSALPSSGRGRGTAPRPDELPEPVQVDGVGRHLGGRVDERPRTGCVPGQRVERVDVRGRLRRPVKLGDHPVGGAWQDTAVSLPNLPFRNLLTNQPVSKTTRIADLLAHLPLAILLSE